MRVSQLVPAGVVLVALAAIGGVAQLDHPAAPRTAAAVTRQVAITSAVRACPPAAGNGSTPVTLTGGRAGAASGQGASGQGASGQGASGQGASGQGNQIDLTALPPAGETVRPASPVRAQGPGVVSLLTLPAGTVTGKKSGSVAQGWSVTGAG